MQGCSPCYSQVACLVSPSSGSSLLAWTPPQQWAPHPSPPLSSRASGSSGPACILLLFHVPRQRCLLASSGPLPQPHLRCPSASGLADHARERIPKPPHLLQVLQPVGGCWILGPPHICSPVDRGAWQAVVPRVAKRNNLSDSAHTCVHSASSGDSRTPRKAASSGGASGLFCPDPPAQRDAGFLLWGFIFLCFRAHSPTAPLP